MTRAIFHPDDDALLNYMIEDGMGIEPEYYLPTLPMILVNGADGIGTGLSSSCAEPLVKYAERVGWSTAIPNFNPVDIVENLRRMMHGEEPEKMNPWFRGFKVGTGTPMSSSAHGQGSIERMEADKYKVSGIIEKIDDKTVEITELPIRKWTQDFKEMLEEFTTGVDNKVQPTVKVCPKIALKSI